MQFSTKEDIEAPIEDVFKILSEFEAFERSAIRRGADVERITSFSPPQTGMKWNVSFSMRGKMRKLDVRLVDFSDPTSMRFDSTSDGLEGYLTLDLVALSSKRTRLSVVLNLKPRTLSARLLLQSLKLAKSNLTKRFKLKVADYAKGIEDRHSSAA